MAEDEETEEPEEGDDRLTVKVRGIVADTIGSLFDSGKAEVVDTSEKKEEPPKRGRRTYRDEQEDMASLVESKVAELLKREKAAGEKHEEPAASEKAPAEPVPGQPKAEPGKRRRIESLMGW